GIDIIHHQLHVKPIPPKVRRPTIPHALSHVTLRLLDVEPDRRPRIEEFAAILSSIEHAQGEPPSSRRVRRPAMRTLVLVGTLLSTAALAAVLYASIPHDSARIPRGDAPALAPPSQSTRTTPTKKSESARSRQTPAPGQLTIEIAASNAVIRLGTEVVARGPSPTITLPINAEQTVTVSVPGYEDTSRAFVLAEGQHTTWTPSPRKRVKSSRRRSSARKKQKEKEKVTEPERSVEWIDPF
ncbi:MAG: hypothetical protein AAF658_21355, partial [Myxococcota bacterium]